MESPCQKETRGAGPKIQKKNIYIYIDDRGKAMANYP
jgi:hypothetical protein